MTNKMKRQLIPEWDNITDYRPPVFKEYEFNFMIHEDAKPLNPESAKGADMAALNYGAEIVGDPSNSKWIERRKLSDAFLMGIEYAKRYLINNA